MQRIDTVVVGGGHAGLAMSRGLTEADRDHVVLERGRVAERWRTERWDSLRLLTPNWMSRLPSWHYDGNDPDGFMTTAALVDHLQRYARAFAAPVHEDTAVREVTRLGDGFRVATDGATWLADNVVVATGYCHRPAVPAAAAGLHPSLTQLSPLDYRNASSLPDGGVLVVGASSSGVQIAAELRRSGREVVLAVGGHTRLPRRYRGRDVLAWLELIGALDRTVDELPADTARRETSLQLVGSAGERGLDLGVLRDAGVELVGRLTGIDGSVVRLADDLPTSVADAERRMRRVLRRIDSVAGGADLHADVPPLHVGPGPRTVHLADRGITTVLWATGFRGAWPWLRLPVVDPAGRIVQRRGRTVVPGLYTVGQRFQHRRSSSFIDGVRHDVADVLSHLAGATVAPVAQAG
jgi:putative flavoprotein involved in K+ transport